MKLSDLINEVHTFGSALRNELSRVEPKSTLGKKIAHHNDMVRGFGAGAGVITEPPTGYHFDKKGLIKLGEKIIHAD